MGAMYQYNSLAGPSFGSSTELIKSARDSVGKMKSQIDFLHKIQLLSPNSTSVKDADNSFWISNEERVELPSQDGDHPTPRRTLQQIHELIDSERRKNRFFADEDLLMETELSWTKELADTLLSENTKLERQIETSEIDRKALHGLLNKCKIDIEEIQKEIGMHKELIDLLERKLKEAKLEREQLTLDLEAAQREKSLQGNRQSKRASMFRNISTMLNSPLSPTYTPRRPRRSSLNPSNMPSPSSYFSNRKLPESPSSNATILRSPRNKITQEGLSNISSKFQTAEKKSSGKSKLPDKKKGPISKTKPTKMPSSISKPNRRAEQNQSLKEILPPRHLHGSSTTSQSVDISITNMAASKKSQPVSIGMVENMGTKGMSLVITLPMETVTSQIVKAFPPNKYWSFLEATEKLKGANIILKLNDVTDFSDIIDGLVKKKTGEHKENRQFTESNVATGPETDNHPKDPQVTQVSTQVEQNHHVRDDEKIKDAEGTKRDSQPPEVVLEGHDKQENNYDEDLKEIQPNSSLISLREQSDGSDTGELGPFKSASSVLSNGLALNPGQVAGTGDMVDMCTQIIDSVNRKLEDQKYNDYEKLPLNEIKIIRARLSRMQSNMDQLRNKGVTVKQK